MKEKKRKTTNLVGQFSLGDIQIFIEMFVEERFPDFCFLDKRIEAENCR